MELRLLAGEKFGIKQALANAPVHVRIVSEEDARKFFMGQLDIFSQYVHINKFCRKYKWKPVWYVENMYN